MPASPSPSGLPFCLAAFAAGALLLQWQSDLPSAGVVGALAAAMAVAANVLAPSRTCHPHARVRRIAGIALATCAAAGAGFGYAAWRAELRLGDALPAQWEGVDIVVVGVIDDLPQPSARGTRFVLAVERVDTSDAIVPSRLSLAWYAASPRGEVTVEPPALAAGERWRLVVRLKRPHGSVNPHGFDVEAWLLENGLRATGYVRDASANARLDAFAGRPGDWIQRARERIRARILAALPDAPYAGVVVALAIGDQRAIPEAQWAVFGRVGITHLISISGLHVTVFATLAGTVAFGLARRSVRLTTCLPARKVAVAVGVTAAFGYVLLAGAQVPAQRTLLMLVVAALGVWVARPGTASLVWLWALVAVLGWDPWAGLTPGFWLSFGAVGLLLYDGTGRLSSPPAATLRARWLHGVTVAARTQALVTVGLVPMTLAVFQQVSLAAPLANALAIPAVTFVVVPLALAGIAIPVDLLFQAAHATFAALMVPLEAMAQAPGSVWQQHAPAPWAVGAALAGVAWLAAPRGVPGRPLGLLWLLPLFVVRPDAPAPGTFRMTVLDVGQGLAVVVQTHRHVLLYDTGPRYTDDADAGGRVIAPFLRAAGLPRVAAMIVTHQDSDHSGGALSLLRTVPVERLASSLPGDHPILLQRQGDAEAGVPCVAGERWEWDGVAFTLLHPGPAHYAIPGLKPNDLSCVVRVDSVHGSALLTGDIEARSELELVRRDPAALAADVLVVPHHGSRTSSTPAFVAAVAPRIAVYTPGYRNRFGHPRADVVARYDAAGARGYRTDHDGALTFTFAPGAALDPRRERAEDRRYWREAPETVAMLPLPQRERDGIE